MVVLGLASLEASVAASLVFITGGLSDILSGMRTLITDQKEYNPRLVFALDAVKLIVDAVETIVLASTLKTLFKNPGAAKALLTDVGNLGKQVRGWFTGQSVSVKGMSSITAAIMSNGNQIFSGQSGSFFPVVADWNNMQSDLRNIQAYDNASD